MEKKYLYGVKHQDFEKNLCEMELKYILNIEGYEENILSNINIDSNRSPFVKHKITIIYTGKELKEIVEQIKLNKLAYDDFKVEYIKSNDGDVNYKERLAATKDIGFVVTGFPDFKNPKTILAITKIKDIWYLGEYERNTWNWEERNKKPFSYSNALGVKTARAIINIAIENNLDLKVIDPCCGIGTVVAEGLDMGIDIKGYELSKQIAANARDNIEHFGYERDRIKYGNMHDVKEFFDVVIVDIPYGLFSPVTKEEQLEILKTSRKLGKRFILISFDKMDEELKEVGFEIIDKNSFSKNKFTRYITICK